MVNGNIAGASGPAWRPTIIALTSWLVLAFALPLAALTLNAVRFAGFPFGFWYTAQGAFIGLALLALVATRHLQVNGEEERPARLLSGSLAFAGEAIASAGFVGFAGLIAQTGFDALAYPLGVAAGLALLAILVAPRFAPQAQTGIGDFFAAHFASVWPCRLAMAMTALATVLLVAADVRGAGLSIQALAGLPPSTSLAAGIGALALVWLLSVLWPWHGRSAAVYLISILALSLPLILMARAQDRLALPYWSYGFALDEAASLEQGLIAQKLADIKSLKPMTSPFLYTPALNFAGILLAMALGVAALPQFLGRHVCRAAGEPAAAPRVAALTLAFVAVFLCGAAPFAAFTRVAIDRELKGAIHVNELPAAVTTPSGMRWLDVCGGASASAADLAAACARTSGHKGILRLQDLTFAPDSYVFAASYLARLPRLATMLFAAGALAAALAAGTCLLAGFPSTFGWRNSASGSRLEARLTGVAILLLGSTVAALSPANLTSLASEGLAVAGASIFPALVLALCWRRFSTAGAVAAMATGFLVAAVYIAGVRLFPATLYAFTSQLSTAAPMAAKKFADLKAAADLASDPAARAGALEELYRQATLVANWWGLKPAAIAILAIPAAFLAGGLVTIFLPRANRNDV